MWDWAGVGPGRRLHSCLLQGLPPSTPQMATETSGLDPLGHCQHCLQGSTEISGGCGSRGGEGGAHTGQIWAEGRGTSHCPLRQEAKQKVLRALDLHPVAAQRRGEMWLSP